LEAGSLYRCPCTISMKAGSSQVDHKQGGRLNETMVTTIFVRSP
jgi:hypothetical protein